MAFEYHVAVLQLDGLYFAACRYHLACAFPGEVEREI